MNKNYFSISYKILHNYFMGRAKQSISLMGNLESQFDRQMKHCQYDESALLIQKRWSGLIRYLDIWDHSFLIFLLPFRLLQNLDRNSMKGWIPRGLTESHSNTLQLTARSSLFFGDVVWNKKMNVDNDVLVCLSCIHLK